MARRRATALQPAGVRLGPWGPTHRVAGCPFVRKRPFETKQRVSNHW
ncbi:hypothetical protein COLSTE_01242 [Collinsella stercoris DSM 13279]|uniref:Uncharacterized protein n=1 Tax=Collinsella stercoris DSM 13279 TaxID=445975 RepID=B6GAZ1_9ACTN|nr:hypothetical protein COLSTE_01242 [Collinsella stercoris DSM 13279]